MLMVELNCEKCNAEISDYKKRVQVLELRTGMTHTYCNKCGEDYQKKIETSNASIAETGKLGHLKGQMSSGSNVRF